MNDVASASNAKHCRLLNLDESDSTNQTAVNASAGDDGADDDHDGAHPVLSTIDKGRVSDA